MTVLPSRAHLQEIGAIARAVGWGTAEILDFYYNGAATRLAVQNTQEGPVTAADFAANDYILKQLRIAVGSEEFGYLSEETYKLQLEAQKSAPLPQSWVWVIDPIDGTRDFIEHTGNYAVHIALVYEKRPVVAVVVLPAAGKLYYAQLGAGAFVETCDGKRTRLAVSQRNRIEDLSLLGSRTHRNNRFNQLLRRFPCKTQKFVGSIGCKIALIVEQQADVYISLSGKSAPKDWDFAAPELILTEAGGQFTHIDGTPLKYNQGDVTQWGCLVASNGTCHDALCAKAEKILADLDS